MSSVLSAKETSDNILNNAELILAAVTEVDTFCLFAFLCLLRQDSATVGCRIRYTATFRSLMVQYLVAAGHRTDTLFYILRPQVRGSGRLKFLLKAFLDLNNALSKAAKQQYVLHRTAHSCTVPFSSLSVAMSVGRNSVASNWNRSRRSPRRRRTPARPRSSTW